MERVEPQDVISRELAQYLVETARYLVPRRELTEREIELWIEHLSGLWEGGALKPALLAYHRAIVQEGLTQQPLEDMEDFLSDFRELQQGDRA